MTVAELYSAVRFVIIGAGLLGIAYAFYRWRVRNRLAIFIFNKSRQLRRYAANPDEQGIIHLHGRAYAYNENFIIWTETWLLKEPNPSLIFEETVPDPIDLYGKVPSQITLSAEELSEIMKDKTVTEFVRAQSSLNIEKVISTVIIVGLILGGVILAGGYYFWTLNKNQTKILAAIARANGLLTGDS